MLKVPAQMTGTQGDAVGEDDTAAVTSAHLLHGLTSARTTRAPCNQSTKYERMSHNMHAKTIIENMASKEMLQSRIKEA